MASGPEAESSPHDETFAELARRIQTGDQTAIQTFGSMFLPGIEFLLRRKLGKWAVATEAARVVAAAVQEIEAASPVQKANLSQMVIRTIHSLFSSASRGVEPLAEETPMENLANSVLAEKTHLEKDILRRYYVLGEPPHKIRTEFQGKTQRNESA